MEAFANHLTEMGYARNTVELYVYAGTQLTERVPQITNESLLEHKDWLVTTFAPKTANSASALSTYTSTSSATRA